VHEVDMSAIGGVGGAKGGGELKAGITPQTLMKFMFASAALPIRYS